MGQWSQFTIRTSCPVQSDTYSKCYRRYYGDNGDVQSNPGSSTAAKGYVTHSYCDTLSNCTGYAQGRFTEVYYELLGIRTPWKINAWAYLSSDANQFISQVKQHYTRSSTVPVGGNTVPALEYYEGTANRIRPGCLIIMGTSGSGHVVFVEDVTYDSNNNPIAWTITDSGYGRSVADAFHTYTEHGTTASTTATYSSSKQTINGTAYTQIGIIYNPAVRWEEDPIPVPLGYIVGSTNAGSGINLISYMSGTCNTDDLTSGFYYLATGVGTSVPTGSYPQFLLCIRRPQGNGVQFAITSSTTNGILYKRTTTTSGPWTAWQTV